MLLIVSAIKMSSVEHFIYFFNNDYIQKCCSCCDVLYFSSIYFILAKKFSLKVTFDPFGQMKQVTSVLQNNPGFSSESKHARLSEVGSRTVSHLSARVNHCALSFFPPFAVDGEKLVMKGANLTSREMLGAFRSRCTAKDQAHAQSEKK